MAAAGRDMRDVELVDADVAQLGGSSRAPTGPSPTGPRSDRSSGSGGLRRPPPGPAGPELPPDPPSGTPVRRRAGRRRLAATAAVGALVLGAAVAGERREAGRLAALAAVPGVLHPLGGPPVELWRIPDAPVGDLRVVDGRLLGAVRGTAGTVDVVGIDPATGRDLWRTPVAAGTAAEQWSRCVVPERAAGAVTALVVCVVVDETATTEQSALGTRTYPTAAREVVVEAGSGEVVRDVPTGPASVLVPLGPDVVVAGTDGTGRAVVRRVDPRSGTPRWTFTSADPVPTDQFRQRSVRLEVAGDLVAVDAGPVWVLSGDGTLVDGWEPDPTLHTGGQVQLLAGGTVLARPAEDDGGWGTEVVEVASGRRATAPGYPLPVRPDDGSLPDVVLMLSVEGRRVLAVEPAGGRTRWSVPAGSGGWPVVVDGRVVRAEGRTLQAHDGRTGEVVWSVPLPAATGSPLVTDGQVVVLSVPGPDGAGALTAVELEDGRRPWTVAVDDELLLRSVDGLLLGWSGTQLLAFGPSRGG